MEHMDVSKNWDVDLHIVGFTYVSQSPTQKGACHLSSDTEAKVEDGLRPCQGSDAGMSCEAVVKLFREKP